MEDAWRTSSCPRLFFLLFFPRKRVAIDREKVIPAGDFFLFFFFSPFRLFAGTACSKMGAMTERVGCSFLCVRIPPFFSFFLSTGPSSSEIGDAAEVAPRHPPLLFSSSPSCEQDCRKRESRPARWIRRPAPSTRFSPPSLFFLLSLSFCDSGRQRRNKVA